MLLSLALYSCNSLPDVGTTMKFKEQGMAAVSETDYNRMIRCEVNEDMVTLQHMVDSVKVMILPAGFTGTLTGKGTGRAQLSIRIKAGRWTCGPGRKIWRSSK